MPKISDVFKYREATMSSSSATIETTTRGNSEVELKEEIIEEILKHIDKKAEAFAAQQSKLIPEIQKFLKNHFLEQTTNKIGFPPNPKSRLKVLIKEEAKRQFEKNGFIKLNFKDFFNSAGLKKLRESHTICQDKKNKIKVTIADRTIEDVVREVNKEEFKKRGEKIPLGRPPIQPCSNNSGSEESKLVNLAEQNEKYNEAHDRVCATPSTGQSIFYAYKKKHEQANLENLNDLRNNAESIKDFDPHREEIKNLATLIETLSVAKDEMSDAVMIVENAWKESHSTVE
jgi:hypothetical protein